MLNVNCIYLTEFQQFRTQYIVKRARLESSVPVTLINQSKTFLLHVWYLSFPKPKRYFNSNDIDNVQIK
jgi:hypothetical protein